MLKPASDICLFTLKKITRQLALHSGLVFKLTLSVTSTPHIFTLPLTANLSLSLPTPLLILQTAHLCCCESAAADRPFLIINHCWLHSQAGPGHVSSQEFMGFQKKKVCTPENKPCISCKKSPCQGKHRGLEEEDSRTGGSGEGREVREGGKELVCCAMVPSYTELHQISHHNGLSGQQQVQHRFWRSFHRQVSYRR